LTADKAGNLYVVDEQQGIVKIEAQTGVQSIYAAPFYPVYTSAFNPPAPLLPNDLAFDKKGYLYVTDTFQATIWRVPPGGGTPTVWFQAPQIDGAFGPERYPLRRQRREDVLRVTFDAGFQGHIYTLPVVDKPTVADMKLFHTYEPGAGPDGIAFGKSGKLYVALAGTSQISVLNADGSEAARYSNPAWQNPANIAFNDKDGTLLVTNHAACREPRIQRLRRLRERQGGEPAAVAIILFS
jgi:sugar lactone lactonase YvrE